MTPKALHIFRRDLRLNNTALLAAHSRGNSIVPCIIFTDEQAREIDSIFVNKDYTPFSRRRDQIIEERCRKSGAAGVPFHSLSAALLIEPSNFGKPSGGPYTVFTPFFKRASLNWIRRPISLPDEIKRCKLHEYLLNGVLAPTNLHATKSCFVLWGVVHSTSEVLGVGGRH